MADTVLAALKSQLPEEISSTDISSLFSRHVSSERLQGALRQLRDLGLVTFSYEGSRGGRRTQLWKAVAK